MGCRRVAAPFGTAIPHAAALAAKRAHQPPGDKNNAEQNQPQHERMLHPKCHAEILGARASNDQFFFVPSSVRCYESIFLIILSPTFVYTYEGTTNDEPIGQHGDFVQIRMTIGPHDQQAQTLNRRYSWQLQLVLIYCA